MRVAVPRVVIADDQWEFRSRLARQLDQDQRVTVIGQAANGQEALELVASTHPDVVLMDVKMPVMDGVEVTSRITRDYPDVRVLILTTFDADNDFIQALKSGAAGCLLKGAEPDDIVSGILAVLSGERVMATPITNRVLDMVVEPVAPEACDSDLTPRELEILKLLATGMPNKQIATSLKISEKTVRNHVSKVYEKLEISDRSQAVLYAVRKGLVEP